MTDSSLAPPSLLAAFIAAQQAFPPIKKSKENKHFGSRYADLSDVNDALIPVLNMYGFAVMQPVENGELVTKLVHAEGTLTSSMPLNLDAKPQELGSQLSYVRRYALCALCGVTSEDDDDGHAASKAKPRLQRQAPKPAVNDDGEPLATKDQAGEFTALCEAAGLDKQDRAEVVALNLGGPKAWKDVTKADASHLIASLKDEGWETFKDGAGKWNAVPAGEEPFDLEPVASGGEPQ